MANEITYADHSGLVLAETLAGALELTLGERVSWRTMGLFKNYTPMAMPGSLTIKIGLANLGLATMTAPGENTGASNTALTSSSATITAAKQSLLHTKTLEAGTAGGLIPSVPTTVAAMLQAYENRFIALMAALFPSLSTSVGSSGVDLSVDNFIDAISAAEAANALNNGAACILHPVQTSDLRNSIRAEGGVLQLSTEAQAMMGYKPTGGMGYFGTFLGIPIFKNAQCNTADSGANRVGALFGSSAFGYFEPNVPTEDYANIPGAQAVRNLLLMQDGTTASGNIALGLHAMLGAGIIQNAGAVKIVTDA